MRQPSYYGLVYLVSESAEGDIVLWGEVAPLEAGLAPPDEDPPAPHRMKYSRRTLQILALLQRLRGVHGQIRPPHFKQMEAHKQLKVTPYMSNGCVFWDV